MTSRSEQVQVLEQQLYSGDITQKQAREQLKDIYRGDYGLEYKKIRNSLGLNPAQQDRAKKEGTNLPPELIGYAQQVRNQDIIEQQKAEQEAIQQAREGLRPIGMSIEEFREQTGIETGELSPQDLVEQTQIRQSFGETLWDPVEKKITLNKQQLALKKLDIETQEKLNKAETQEEQEKIMSDYRKRQTEIYVGKDYSLITKDIQQTNYNNIPLKIGFEDMYDYNSLSQASQQVSTLKNTLFGSGDYKKVSKINELLRKSGYYTALTRPTSVTMGKEEIKVKDIADKGREISNKLWKYETVEAGKYAAKTYGTLVGVPYVAKTLQTTALIGGKGIKTGLNVLGKGLQVAYGYSVYKRSKDIIKDVKENEIYSVLQKGVRLGTELATYKIVSDIIKKPKLEWTGETTTSKVAGGTAFKRQGVIVDKTFGGKFEKGVEITGLISDKGTIDYTTVFTNNKGKILTSIKGFVRPLGTPNVIKDTKGLITRLEGTYKGYELQNGEKIRNIAFDTNKGGVISVIKTKIPLTSPQKNGIDIFKTSGYKGEKSISTDVTRIDKGFFFNKLTRTITSAAGSYVKGETTETFNPYATKTTTETSYNIKNTRFGKLLKIAAVAPVTTLMGGGNYNYKFKTSPITTTTVQSSRLSVSMIEPSPQTTIVPVVSIFDKGKTETGLKRKISFKPITFEEELKIKQITKQEEEIKPDEIIRSRPSIKGENIIKPQEEQIFTPKNIIKPEIIQTPQEETIQTQKIDLEEQIIKPETPIVENPPPPPPPIVYIPTASIDLRTSKRKSVVRKGLSKYKPSVLGIEKGVKGETRGILTGFEVRGIPTTTKSKKVKKIRITDSLGLKPVKSGIGTKFKVEKTKKKKKFKIKEGKVMKFFKNAAKVKL